MIYKKNHNFAYQNEITLKQKNMKKVILSIATIVCCGMLTSCGMGMNGAADNSGNAGNGSILGAILTGGQTGNTGSNTGSVLGNIISIFAGDVLTNQNTLVGTWNYTQPCVQFESESLLAKAGGAVIAEKAEATLATYYQKIGITPGSCRFTFNSNKTLQYTIGSKTFQGSYVFDSSKKTVTITTQMGSKITAYVSITGRTMGLTFDASKLLTLINSASTASSTLSSIGAIAGNYSGMKLGFEFIK